MKIPKSSVRLMPLLSDRTECPSSKSQFSVHSCFPFLMLATIEKWTHNSLFRLCKFSRRWLLFAASALFLLR